MYFYLNIEQVILGMLHSEIMFGRKNDFDEDF